MQVPLTPFIAAFVTARGKDLWLLGSHGEVIILRQEASGGSIAAYTTAAFAKQRERLVRSSCISGAGIGHVDAGVLDVAVLRKWHRLAEKVARQAAKVVGVVEVGCRSLQITCCTTCVNVVRRSLWSFLGKNSNLGHHCSEVCRLSELVVQCVHHLRVKKASQSASSKSNLSFSSAFTRTDA
ncbi:uncharacterized protein IWZ02DRAFT_222425 [Phyllosticta citriasiana]|uniref:uncharacterized protein n=1 Tax=Phyllosticta citriasiana TaxID=595635 RepID=UPI0030FD5259